MSEHLTDERLAEIRSLLRYESSISFHSARAKESMLLLLAEVESRGERIAALEDDRVRLLDQQAKDDDEYVQALAERDRYRIAWQSARSRAQAFSEGILRHVADRDAWKGWCKKAEGRVAELEGDGRLTSTDVATWLGKKAREYPTTLDRRESPADAIARLASKVSRGAIRPAELRGAAR